MVPRRIVPAAFAVLALLASGLLHAQHRGPEKAPGMASTAPPGLVIDSPHVQFPDAFQSTTIRHTYRFENRGPREVVLEEGLAIKSGGRVTFRPSRIPPGTGGTIDVEQDLEDELGATGFRFALISDEPGVARYRMSLSGFVLPAYTPEQPLVRFGRVARGKEAEKSFELFSREVDRLEVTGVDGAPEYLRVTTAERAGLAGEGVVVRLRLGPHPPLGLTTGAFTLRTNVSAAPRATVHYAVEAWDDVAPDAHPLSFEMFRVGEDKPLDVRLTSRSGNAFEVRKITDPAGIVEGESEPCSGSGPSPCAVLHLTARLEVPESFRGVLHVQLAGESEVLPLTYGGLVIGANAQVRDLGSSTTMTDSLGQSVNSLPPSLFDEAAAPAPGPTPGPTPRPAPMATPVPTPSPGPSAPTAPPRGARLAWKARNDESLYGYIVFRADKEIGPFRRVSDVIRVQPEPKVEHRYDFVDATALPGRTYFYYLDTVSQRGLTERFSPVRARTVAAP